MESTKVKEFLTHHWYFVQPYVEVKLVENAAFTFSILTSAILET